MFYYVKRLHTNNREEYIILELQSFLREQEIIHKTSTLFVYQQNSCAKQLNYILLKKHSQYDLKHIYQIFGKSLLLQL